MKSRHKSPLAVALLENRIFRSNYRRQSIRNPRSRRLLLEQLEDRLSPAVSLSVTDISVAEGNESVTWAVFTLTLSEPSPDTITVDLSTSGGNATPGVDYYPNNGTLYISPGETSSVTSVGIIGDTYAELDEVFFLVLANPTGATLATEHAKGTIVNDDGPVSPPVAQPDHYDVGEDQTFTTYYSSPGVLANDSSSNGSLTASLVSGPAHGTLQLLSSGSFTYTPAPEYNGPDSFVYRATDELGLYADATASITVWPMNDPTILTVPGPQTTAEETPITFSAANGNSITITDLDQPRMLVALLVSEGILTLPNTDGLEFYPGYGNNSAQIAFYADNPAEANAALNGLVFTPNLNYNSDLYGNTYLNVMARDEVFVGSYPNEVYSYVPITVTSVNDAPVAFPDSYYAWEDETYQEYLGVLGNDQDIDNYSYTLTAVLQTGPSHGTLTLNPNGTFTYRGNPNYNGPDSFTYRARDPGGLLSNPATVSIYVYPMDDPIEVTAPGPQTIAEDTTLTFSVANGKAITIIDIESPRVLVSLFTQHAILSLATTAGLEFPDPTSLNNSPRIIFYADSPAIANAAMDGLVLTPDPNFPNPYDYNHISFDVWVQDTTIVSYPVTDSADVPITVTPVDDAPVAVNDNYAVFAGVAYTTSPYWYPGGYGNPGVLANDTDVEWDTLSAVLVSGPAHGALSFNADGSFTYTADLTYTGTDSFTYRAFDGQLQSNIATATFTVAPNLPPVAVADAYSMDEDGLSLYVPYPGVLANDSDPEGQPINAEVVSGPAHGYLIFYPWGSFIYGPDLNYNGTDQFWYRISDGNYFSDPVAVTLTVNPVNDAPVASNDSYSVDEDGVLTSAAPGVLGNDVDVDSPMLSATLVGGPSHGVLTFNANGSFTYTPNANYNGSDSFTYKANDGALDSNVATVSITVNAVNDAPVAVNDAYTLNEDTTLNIAPTPGVTSLIMVSQPGDYIGQGQTYNYTPATGTFFANRNFDNGVSIFYSGSGHSWNLDFAAPYDANLTPGYYADATRWPFQAMNVPGLNISGDGRGSNTLTGNFTVTQALYAADGSVLRFAATFEQHSEGATPALTGEIKFNQGDGPSGILINDSDVEGQPLTIIIVSGPAHGTLSMNVDGSFKYTPQANYNGTDSFTYKVSDGTSESNVATVALTINPVNDFPTANDDSYTVAEDNVLNVAAPGVLANDFDVDGDSLTATLVTSPTHGSLVFNTDGSFVYTPNANYNGTDSFMYAALDTTGAFSFIRTVTLVVTSVNDAPVAGDDSYTTAEDTALTVSAPGVLGNDADVEGTSLAALLVSGPTHGALTLNSNGSFTYTPDANYHGSDSFTYKANDGAADSNVATVTLTVSSVNDAPTAGADAYAVDEDNALTVAAPGLLGNDSDVDGDALSAVLVSGPAHGALTLNSDGSLTYTPNNNYNGSDSFTYKVNDGSADSNVATVTLTINSVNDAPVAADDAITLTEDGTLTVVVPGALGNDSDADGDALTAILVSGPVHGLLTFNADGSFTYTPTANYNGADAFTYKANDGSADSNVATVSLTITAVNDAPVASGDTFTLAEDSTLTVAAPGVLSNDSDADGDALTAVLVAAPVHGSLTLNANGSFTYTPTANYNGAESFTYKANDGSADSNVATVSLTITSVNDAPVAAGDAFVLTEDGTLTTVAPGVLGNDSDAEGDALTAMLVSGPAHGSLTLNADGSLTYSPAANYNGADSFTYKVNDGSADSNVVTVSLTITAVNDAPVASGDTFTLAEDSTLTVAAPGALGNDSDGDGDALIAALVSGPAHGSLTFNADGSFTYTPAANYNGADSFTYRANDGSADSNVATVALTINAVNDAPVANAGPDASNAEGATCSFSGAGSSDIDGDALSYSWDFGDGASASGATVNHAFADQGTYTVTLTVSDGSASSSDTLVMTVFNGAPLALINGPASGVRGQARTFTFGALDPSPVDQASSFTYSINWGDGQSQTVVGPNSVPVDHVFAATGNYLVSVTATDKDGGVSSVAQQQIIINVVEMQQGNLVVGGTTTNDNIVLKVADTQGGIKVTIGGANLGTFAPTGNVLVFAQAGGDQVKFTTSNFSGVTYYVQAPAVVLGGDGNDTIDARGSSAANVLVGGAGTDQLYGGTGRDILIGGTGADTLRAGTGEDVLIGNGTIYDANLAALLSLIAEWNRADADYATRAAHLQGAPGGLNGNALLNVAAAPDDSTIDQLYGEGGLDVFFATTSGNNKDKVNDLAAGEIAVAL